MKKFSEKQRKTSTSLPLEGGGGIIFDNTRFPNRRVN
jgi:hypothetical protein